MADGARVGIAACNRRKYRKRAFRIPAPHCRAHSSSAGNATESRPGRGHLKMSPVV